MERKRYGLYLFLLCWIAYFTAYIARSNYAVLISEMMASGGYSKLSMGVVGTFFFLAYGIGQLVNGLLADRFSPVKMIFIGLMLSAVTNLLMGVSDSVLALQIIWSCNGFALSMVWSPIIKIFSVYMPQELKKKAAFNISTTIPLGTLAAYGLSSLVFLITPNWRTVFIVSSAVIFILALVYGVFIGRVVKRLKEMSVEDAEIVIIDNPEKLSNSSLMSIDKKRFLPIFLQSGILIVVVAVMCNGIIKDGVNMWIPTYLKEQYGLGTLATILTVAIIPIFNLSGIYIGQFINSKINSELKSTSIIFIFATIVLAVLALGVHHYILAIILLAITTALMLGANSLMLSVFPLYFSRYNKTATVTGFLNFSSYVACAMSTYVFGALSDKFGWAMTQWVWVAVALLGSAAAIGASANRFTKTYK